MATEELTLRDIRTVTKLADGIRLGGWEAGDPNNPLITPLQDMADDIAAWFNPDQNWRLFEVRTSLVNLKRIKQSSVQEKGPNEGEPVMRARTEESDNLTPVFFFKSERPPLKRGWFRRRDLDLPRVFSSDSSEFIGKIVWDSWNQNGVDVFPHKLGAVLSLEQALQELSSPYFLRMVRLTTSFRSDTQSNHGLTAMVLIYDLVDYTRLRARELRGEANKMNGIHRQLEKKFSPDYMNLLQ